MIRNAAARYHDNAIYVFASKNAVMQDNDVSFTSYHDLEGTAYDSDYNSEGTIIQYNVSHDNGGGLADICNNPDSKAPARIQRRHHHPLQHQPQRGCARDRLRRAGRLLRACQLHQCSLGFQNLVSAAKAV